MLRAKPGRADMADVATSSSMSCTDKIARWMTLGLQGLECVTSCSYMELIVCLMAVSCHCRGLLAGVLQEEVYLRGVIVGEDVFALPGEQLRKLSSSLADRHLLAVESVSSGCAVGSASLPCPPPALFLTSHQFPGGKCSSEAQQYEEERQRHVKSAASTASDFNCRETSLGGSKAGKDDGEGEGGGLSKKRCLDKDECKTDGHVGAGSKKDGSRLKSGGTSLSWIADTPYDPEWRRKKSDLTSRRREVCGGSVEVVISSTGRPQGYVPPKQKVGQSGGGGSDVSCAITRKGRRMESRLCRR